MPTDQAGKSDTFPEGLYEVAVPALLESFPYLPVSCLRLHT